MSQLQTVILTWFINILSTIFLNLDQELANFYYVGGDSVNILGFASHTVSAAITQLHHCSTETAYIPVKLYLAK